MSYRKYFEGYYNNRPYSELKINAYIALPEKLAEGGEILRYDGYAVRAIAECKAMIETLTEYRADLGKRFIELETMSYSDTLKLSRDPSFDGRKYYIITITRTFTDGTTQQLLYERHPGKERSAAFKRFAELQKLHPGIRSEQDTARRAWEK